MFEGQSKPAQRETFQSFKQERAGSLPSSAGYVEEEIHIEATQVAAQQRSYFVSMMTGVSTS